MASRFRGYRAIKQGHGLQECSNPTCARTLRECAASRADGVLLPSNMGLLKGHNLQSLELSREQGKRGRAAEAMRNGFVARLDGEPMTDVQPCMDPPTCCMHASRPRIKSNFPAISLITDFAQVVRSTCAHDERLLMATV